MTILLTYVFCGLIVLLIGGVYLTSDVRRLKDFMKWFLAIPNYCTEKGYYNDEDIETPVRENDPLFSILLVMLTASVFLVATTPLTYLFKVTWWQHGILAFATGDTGLLLAIWLFLFEKVPRDVLASRQFLGPTRYFSNGNVFHIKFGRKEDAHLSMWTKLVRYPSGLRHVKSGASVHDENAIISQLRQDPLDGAPGGTQKDSDDQFFRIKMTYQLALGKRPETIVRAYNDQFSRARHETLNHAQERGMRTVDGKVLEIVTAFADEILQQFRVDEFLVDIGVANDALMNGMEDKENPEREIPGMSERLLTIGVELVTIAVETMEDVVETGGYKSERNKYRRAENASYADQRSANADREARIAEWNAQSAILVAQEQTLLRALTNRRISEETELQQFKLYMEMLAERESWAPAALQSYLAMSPENQIAFVQRFSDALQAAGLQIGGSLVVVGGDGMKDTHRPTPGGVIVGILREVFEMFGVTLPPKEGGTAA